jgi:hypothetical protein
MCKKYIHAAKVDKCGSFPSSTNWPRSSSFMFSGKEKIMMQRQLIVKLYKFSLGISQQIPTQGGQRL